MKVRKFNIYRIPASFLDLRTAVLLLLGLMMLGTVVYMYLEKYDLGEAFYMVIITLSTVGYTEVRPLSEAGRIFTSIFILLNFVTVTYILAVFSYYIVQGEIFKTMHLNFVQRSIDQLSDHIILAGYGKYGKEIAAHLKNHNLTFVVIDRNPDEIEAIQKSEDKILYVEDDATHDDALLQAGIRRANALISALPDDSDNVFTVLSARQLNPKINIISRALHPKSQRKLQMAGADHVVMPEQIGGFYMATLVTKPGAIDFFSFITNEYESDIGFEEILYEELPSECTGKSIRELRLRKVTGANIIGYRSPRGEY